ncbi:MAG TPA: Crp/Fnr family transcriptional regulator [Bacillota bacterium]|nr:Crp/Fnr family transcriptional regulator [Bacillota bacterium]
MSNSMCFCSYHSHQPCARKVPIFASLNDEELQRVISLIIQKKFPKGSLICREGEPLSDLLLINRGKVKVYRISADGKEQILYILTEGDFFGERNLLLEKKMADYNAETMEDTLVCMITGQDCHRLLLDHPEISLKIMEELCERIDKLENLLSSISPRETDNRICLMLLEFRQKYGKPQPDGTVIIALPLNREEMANYIGVTRETVSRKLNALKEAGIIDFIGNKKIQVRDEKALEEVCQLI